MRARNIDGGGASDRKEEEPSDRGYDTPAVIFSRLSLNGTWGETAEQSHDRSATASRALVTSMPAKAGLLGNT